MFSRQYIPVNIIVLLVTGGLLISCGPSAEEQAATSAVQTAEAATDTPTPIPTDTPTPTSTPVPYDLSLVVSGEKEAPIVGAEVVIERVDVEAGTQYTDDVGQVFWNDLSGGEVALNIRAQGYYPLATTESLERGINQISISLERDPHGLLPSEACGPGERLLYLEDFQDGHAQGWPEIEQQAQGWELNPHPDTPSNLVASNNGVSDTQIVLEEFFFDHAVWRIRFMPVGRPAYIFNWHFVTEPYEVKDGIINFSNYTIAFPEQVARFVRGADPFPEVVLLDIERGMATNEWHDIEISTYFDTLEVWLDGFQLLKYTDPNPLPGGPMGLELWGTGSDQNKVYFDNIAVCELKGPFIPMLTPES